MKKIWLKFGRGILNYHAAKGIQIKYIPYSAPEDGLLKYKNSFKVSEIEEYHICFVIAGTGSKKETVQRNINYVCTLMNCYQQYGKSATFKIVMYYHPDEAKKVTEQLPADRSFTKTKYIIESMLNRIEVQDGRVGPETLVDGLATATTKCKWTSSKGVKNIIFNMFDASPLDNLPDYLSPRCTFDWRKDVWKKMHKYNIEYKGISEENQYNEFENIMDTNLGELCTHYHWVERKDDTLSIFIDYEVH